MSFEFTTIGAEHLPGAMSGAELNLLTALTGRELSRGPATRLWNDPALNVLLSPGSSIDKASKDKLGLRARPVRAVIFDKRPGANWALGWHQDRTIAVQTKCEVSGYERWSMKAGIQHVEPPYEILARMITIRAHLDACPIDNAPLMIVPGSHAMGRMTQPQAALLGRDTSPLICEAEPGDLWIYATTIVHASRAAKHGDRRRVLHVDYSTDELPEGLEWLPIE